MSLNVRHATLADLDRLLQLEEEHPSDRFNRPQLRYLLTRANSLMLVAQDEEVADPAPILGNVIVLFRRGISSAHLYSLTVDPAARGRGVAKLLLREAQQATLARGYRRMILEVRSDNEAAAGLYLSEGYRVTGHRESYYADGCDALSMEKLFG